MIYGAGRTGVAALQEIQENWRLGMRPIGFVVDERTPRARLINGYPAVSTRRLREMIEQRAFDVLVVVNPRVELKALLSIVEQCEQAGIAVTRFGVQWQGVTGAPEAVTGEDLAYGTADRETASLQ
ncbi:MAG: nucleoside-diphosphate sugar epimerase/dehydratase [Candidatus Binatia bacterium]